MIEPKERVFQPQLADLLNLLKDEIMTDMNCHAIAKVTAFDSAKKTVQAKIMYSRTYFDTMADGTRKSRLVEYPLLMDVPIIRLGGGSAYLTFPIAPGDECLILFNDRDMDNWMSGAKSGPVNTPRAHAFSDGIALIGFLEIASYDTTRAVLGNGAAYVGVSTTKVKIANGSTTLKTLFDNLINEIKNITVTCAAAGSPSSTPINSAALEALKTQIGGLLE